jgi:hypothetical protein
MACQSKYILKTIIDVNLGFIAVSICTILSIAYNVIFDGHIDSVGGL